MRYTFSVLQLREEIVGLLDQGSLMNLKAGDVVIRRKAGISTTSFAAVTDDGVMPEDWMIGSLTDALAWATETMATNSTVHEIDQDGRPFSN